MAALPLTLSHTNLFETDEFNDYGFQFEAEFKELPKMKEGEGNTIELVKKILNSGRYKARKYSAPALSTPSNEEYDSGLVSDYEQYKQLSWLTHLSKPNNQEELNRLAAKFNVDPNEILKYADPKLLDTYAKEIGASINKPTPLDYDAAQWEKERDDLISETKTMVDAERVAQTMGGVLPHVLDFFDISARGAVEGMLDTRRRQENLVKHRGVKKEDVGRGYVSEFFPIESRWRFIVSPNDLSLDETKNVLPFDQQNDPTLSIGYEFNDDFDIGVLISNKNTNNSPIPFKAINPLEQTMTGYDAEPLLNEIMTVVGQESLPLITGTIFSKKTSDAFRDKATKAIKDMAEGKSAYDDDLMKALGGIGIPDGDIPIVDDPSDIFKNKTFMAKWGPRLEETLSVAAAAAAGDVIPRFFTLMGGTIPLMGEPPVQPQLATPEGFLRVAKSSGLLFAYAFATDTVGEILLSGAGKTWKAFTGKRVPPPILDRLQVLAERYRQNLGIFSPTTKTGELKDLSEPEMQKVLGEWVDKNGAKLAGKLDLRTFANLSQNEKLMGLQHWFIESLSEGDKAASAIERMFTAPESNLLDRFYTSIYQKLEDDQRKYLPSKKAINDHFQELRQNSKKGELSQAQTDLINAEAEVDLNKILGDRLTPNSRKEAAARITDRAPSVDPMTMDKNPLFTQINQNYDTNRADFFDLLESEEFREVKLKIGNDVKDSFEPLVDADLKKIFASEDAIETAAITRSAVPGREGGLVNIESMLAKEAADPVAKYDVAGKLIKPEPGARGVLLEHREVSLGDVIEAIRDVEIYKNQSSNQDLKSKLEKFQQSLIKVRDKGYKKQAKLFNQSYEDEVNLTLTNLDDLRDQISGRYIASLVDQGDTELGAFVLNSRPKEIQGYFELANQLEKGYEQVADVRALVTDEIRKELSLPMPNGANPTPLEAATRFRKLKADKKEQLELIFGKEELAGFNKFDQMFNESRKSIEAAQKTASKMEKLLEKSEITRPTQVIDQFLTMNSEGRLLFEETPLRDTLVELSKLADENPELRKNLRSYFASWLDTNLTSRPDKFKEFSRDVRMSRLDKDAGWSGFDLDKLTNFALGYPNNQAFARDLALIVGKEDAGEYASALRVLAKRLDLLNQKPTAGASVANRLLKDISAPEERGKRAVASPLGEFSRRVTLTTELVSNLTMRNMAWILTDPAKIRNLNKQLAREVDTRTFLKVLTNAALGRSVELGTEQNISDLQQFIDSIDARRLELIGSNLWGDEDVPVSANP